MESVGVWVWRKFCTSGDDWSVSQLSDQENSHRDNQTYKTQATELARKQFLWNGSTRDWSIESVGMLRLVNRQIFRWNSVSNCIISTSSAICYFVWQWQSFRKVQKWHGTYLLYSFFFFLISYSLFVHWLHRVVEDFHWRFNLDKFDRVQEMYMCQGGRLLPVFINGNRSMTTSTCTR